MSLKRTLLNPVQQAAGAAMRGGLIAACLVFGPQANAALSFTFDYSANTAGLGFLDPVTGAARQAALNNAAAAYSAMFGTFFTDSASVVMKATSSDNSGSGTLMSAGSSYYGPFPGFGLAEVMLRKIQTGVDINEPEPLAIDRVDGQVDVNWGHSWDVSGGLPTNPAEFDFFAALNHEFTHALGFASGFITNPAAGTPAGSAFGKDFWGNAKPVADGGNGAQGSFAAFDQFLSDCQGNAFVNAGTLLSNPGVIAPAVTGGGVGTCFTGANARLAYGNRDVDLFAPASYIDGSSVSHLNTDNVPSFGNSMMKHNRGQGDEARVFNAVEVGILADIGYTLTQAGRDLIARGLNDINVIPGGGTVPEPGSLALLLLALGGAAAARRKLV